MDTLDGCFRSLAVVDDCVAFTPVNQGLHIMGAFPGDCDDRVDVAVGC